MNQIIVFSQTTKRWIAPQSDCWLWYETGIRKRQGEEAIITVGSKAKDEKVKVRRVHVMVEKSDNGFWWLVERKIDRKK